MMNSKFRTLALAVALTLGLSAQAQAAGILDFGIVAPTTGTISFAGGATPLMGTNIDVDNVVGLGTPANNNVLRNCIGCILTFTTGNLQGSTATSWIFGDGPTTSIKVTGAVDLDGGGIGPGDVGFGGPVTLLDGSFQGLVTVTITGGTFRVFGAGFVDVKNADLAAFYGLPGGPSVQYSGAINLSFQASGTPPNGFTSTQVLSGDIVNQVDLPSSLLLLGSGLVGFAYLSTRTRRS